MKSSDVKAAVAVAVCVLVVVFITYVNFKAHKAAMERIVGHPVSDLDAFLTH